MSLECDSCGKDIRLINTHAEWYWKVTCDEGEHDIKDSIPEAFNIFFDKRICKRCGKAIFYERKILRN